MIVAGRTKADIQMHDTPKQSLYIIYQGLLIEIRYRNTCQGPVKKKRHIN